MLKSFCPIYCSRDFAFVCVSVSLNICMFVYMDVCNVFVTSECLYVSSCAWQNDVNACAGRKTCNANALLVPGKRP